MKNNARVYHIIMQTNPQYEFYNQNYHAMKGLNTFCVHLLLLHGEIAYVR